jgi:hypothetical protein
MLLNEFLKVHCKVEHLEKRVENLLPRVQKVSGQHEVNKPAPQMSRSHPVGWSGSGAESSQSVVKSLARLLFTREKVVEPTGFEPVTSSMPLRRSTN